MASTDGGFWHRHGWTIVLLTTAFGLGLFIRTVFSWALLHQFGPLYLYGGGSDSFYHSHVMEYIVNNHTNLVRDPLLRYPTGAVNPREPLFDWMNAVLGILFAPFFGGNAVKAGSFFLDFQAPLWSALGVVPVYLIGKEVSSRRMGIVAAFLYPLMVANIDSSVFGYANYLSFYVFFILLTVYCYLRTVRAAGTRRWVESYRHPRQILAGLRSFARVERNAVKWAVLTGVSLGALALAWQGYSFAVAAIVVFLAFAMIVERIRRVDSFGLYVVTWIVGLVGFPMAVPYYLPQGLFAGWFNLPLLVFFGALAILLPFLLLRDLPYVFSLPILGVIAAAGIGLLDVVNHAFFVDIVTGQGYFVKTLVYSTVAEAQAPSIDALILGYGVITFFLAFVGLILVLVRLIRGKFARVLMLFSVFAVISIYLPVSAAKFFFLGSAAFSLLSAEAIVQALQVANYPQLRRTVASLADRRSQFGAFRRAFKLRHLLVMVVLVGILLPNIWYAIDAGVPYNVKSQYNRQIFDTLPPPLRTSPSNASSFYLGAAGTQLDTPTQYDENGYDWLATQDTNLPQPQRPAFVSWWDYGFQAVAEGKHPTVADNFQNGIVPAGNFLLSQNESQAIAILATTLLTAEATTTGQPYLPPALNALLAADGVNLATLHSLMTNTSQDMQLVLAHPERYLPVDPAHLDGANALYDTMAWFLATTLPAGGVAQVYNDVQAFTHWSIRYAMVDSRLFPFSGSNTGIFYAPADLTDRVIGAGGAPTSYYTVSVLGSNGNTYPLGSVPAGVAAVQYNINRLPAFYNTMIFKIFVGYNGTQIGVGGGIPGLEGAAAQYPVQPGWMLQHFEVVYKTAYYCPTPSTTTNPNCPYPANVPEAVARAKATNGTAFTDANHYFSGGETMLAYYAGQPMTGQVTLPDGTPVGNVRLTVYDSFHIPHMTVVTSANGAYNLLLPPGNDTVNVTAGRLDGPSQAGTDHLASLHFAVSGASGFSLDTPAMVRPIVLGANKVQGFVYWNTANNSSYQPGADALVAGASAVLWAQGFPTQTRTTDASGSFHFTNVPPGVYNLSIVYGGRNFTQPQETVPSDIANNTKVALAPGTVLGTVRMTTGFGIPGAVVTVRGSTGVVATTVTGTTGNYTIKNLAAGNYSISATYAVQGLGSGAVALAIGTTGTHTKLNLTLVPTETLTLTVLANGNPVPAFPVRFQPILPPPQVTTTAPSPGPGGPGGTGGSSPTTRNTPTLATANSSVFLSDGSGFITAVLPAGNYSLYGYGLLGSTWYAGFASAYVGSAGPVVALAPLAVAPAVPLGGSVALPSGPITSLTSSAVITAYDARGDQVSTFSNASGHWSLPLPAGRYSLLATQGAIGGSAGISAALQRIDLRYTTSLALTLVPGAGVHLLVGSPTFGGVGPLAPALSASVSIALEPMGATVTALSNASGNVTLVVPGTVPAGASYCLNATAFGYAPYHLCGIAANSIGSIGTVPLSLQSVPVNVRVVGLPAGARLHLNLTALSSTGHSTNATGGDAYNLTLAPGTYRLTAYAPATTGGGLYLPRVVTNVTIPVGSQQTNITLTVVRQVTSHGSLVLPNGVTTGAVTIRLTSPAFTTVVSGTTFQGKFFAAPGTYTAYATASVANATFATVATVTFNATGVLAHPLVATGRGALLEVNLTLPTGVAVNATVPLNLTGPGGLVVSATANAGRGLIVLPVNTTFVPTAQTVQFVPNGSSGAYEALSVRPGTTCHVTGATSFCVVTLVGTTVLTPVDGSLAVAGFPAQVPGTVRFQGPGAHGPVTTVAAANGSFSALLTPGVYSIYAWTNGGGLELANASSYAVPATPGPALLLRLGATWTDTVTILPPAGTSPPSANLTFSGPGGVTLQFPDSPIGTRIPVVLPLGVWKVTAATIVSPYGVATTANATAAVPLLAGNAATELDLAVVWHRSVAFTLGSPTSVVLGNGGVASFAATLRNTGNIPLTLHFLGSPSFWNFSFSPSNVTLGVATANATAGLVVTIVVPPNTDVAHPTAAIEALLPDGSLAGTITPAPSISVTPRYAFAIGAPPATPPTIAPTSAIVPFYLANKGNVPISVSLTVLDAARLTGLGWSARVYVGNAPLLVASSLPTGTNSSFSVHLAAPSGHALPPGSVTVLALILNTSSSVGGSVTLNVPALTVNLNSTSLVVTGPSLGSPPAYPDWLVPVLAFVPATGFLVAAGTYRWLRTRRWRRA
ncbi:MAG: carboxypeptidase regulatory-like domain-containing protein [Thermoplasmata archaeon]|nr:carboxypeptidase regulatory-like domain-containing protein [Thermoplasmata archaeon]